MDEISAKILNELLGAEKELPARPVSRGEQPPAADHWTRPVLMERAAYLAKLAKYGEGSATETIKEYPQHSVLLSFRSRNSEAETHEHFAHVVLVLNGNATLVCGGTLAGSTRIAPGLLHGASVEGGVRYQLCAGDVIHIPAGRPHQLLVTGDNTLTCLVLRIQEIP
jgi:uncharacterized RmlC-like cupin family protein